VIGLRVVIYFSGQSMTGGGLIHRLEPGYAVGSCTLGAYVLRCLYGGADMHPADVDALA